jgi:hypothetical protein
MRYIDTFIEIKQFKESVNIFGDSGGAYTYSNNLADMFYRELAGRKERGRFHGTGYGWIA